MNATDYSTFTPFQLHDEREMLAMIIAQNVVNGRDQPARLLEDFRTVDAAIKAYSEAIVAASK